MPVIIVKDKRGRIETYNSDKIWGNKNIRHRINQDGKRNMDAYEKIQII